MSLVRSGQSSSRSSVPMIMIYVLCTHIYIDFHAKRAAPSWSRVKGCFPTVILQVDWFIVSGTVSMVTADWQLYVSYTHFLPVGQSNASTHCLFLYFSTKDCALHASYSTCNKGWLIEMLYRWTLAHSGSKPIQTPKTSPENWRNISRTSCCTNEISVWPIGLQSCL